jgi:hypothetical protein
MELRLCRSTSLANDAPAFPLGRAAPDPLLLAELKRVLKARHPHGALGTNGLGFGRVIFFSVRIEDMGFKAAARALFEPYQFCRADQTCRHA